MSLVGRLLEWLFAPVLTLWLATALITFISLHEVLDSAADQRLQDASEHVHNIWLSANGNTALLYSMLSTVGGVRERSYKVAVFDRNEKEQVSTFAEPLNIAVDVTQGAVKVLNIEDENARCAINRYDQNTLLASRVVVCDLSHTRTQQSVTVFRHILVPQSLILLAALFLVWYGLTYILRPLTRLREDLDRRGMDDLRAINTKEAPHELEPLLVSINRLMERLTAGFASQRRFIANAAHQLRTPLAAINTRIELADRLLAEGKLIDAQEILRSQALLSKRTTRLANQMLTLARSETAELVASTQEVLISRCVAQVLARSFASAESKNVALTYEEYGDTPRWIVLGDAALIEEAITNVIENAIAFAPQVSEVQCIADATCQEVRIIDSGPGIAAEDKDRLFKPFMRGTHAVHSGSGLGLAIVREIMRRHGGEAHFSERPAGTGACVILSFPSASIQNQLSS